MKCNLLYLSRYYFLSIYLLLPVRDMLHTEHNSSNVVHTSYEIHLVTVGHSDLSLYLLSFVTDEITLLPLIGLAVSSYMLFF